MAALEYLPVLVNDGTCNHLIGQRMPNSSLPGTCGQFIDLRKIKYRFVIYCYPMTGQPGTNLPEGWEQILGARGCTPQACSFHHLFHELQLLNTAVFGLSTQTTAYQQEAKARLHLPFELFSDEHQQFTAA